MTEVKRPTIILMPIFLARAGLGSALEAELDVLQRNSRGDEGCRSYSVFADLTDPDRFVLFEEWESQAHLDAHNKQMHVRRFSDRIAEWLDRPFEVSRLRIVAKAPED